MDLLGWVIEVISDGRGRVRANGVARLPLAVSDRLQDLIVRVACRILKRKDNSFEFHNFQTKLICYGNFKPATIFLSCSTAPSVSWTFSVLSKLSMSFFVFVLSYPLARRNRRSKL